MIRGRAIEGSKSTRRKLRAVVLFAAAACFVHVASAVTAVHDGKGGWKFFRDGADAPFAEMAEPSKDVALSVRAVQGASFVFIDVAPAAGDADRVAGVVSLPDIRLRRFSASPVKMGSAGLGRMDDGVVSCGYLAIAEPYSRRGVVTAWLTNLKACGAFDGRQDAEGRVVVTPIADYGPMLVKANRRQVADTFVVGEFDDCRLGLEAYADAAAERFSIRLPPNETGYCTWCSDRYGYSDRSVSKRGCGAGTEASTAEFAALAAKTLKPYGFDFIQFDDQWQAGNPDLNGPARDFTRTDSKGPYPDGFGKTVALLREKGFRAGLWFIPFGGVADDPAWAGKSNLFVRSAVEVPKTVRCSAYRQPLVLARRKGDPIKTEWGGECLDMTKPEARAYLEDIVHRFTYDWGFRYLKTDGIFTGFGCDLYGGYAWKDVNFANAVFSDPEASNVSAFREGFQTMRRAAAPGTFILGCNLGTIRAMVPSFGLVDGMRIGNDNGPIDQSPKRYIEGPKAGSCRYFLNGRVWWADPDSTYVRAAVPIGRARSMASWTALTDSLFEVGDWLPDLPEERVEILRRTMAHHGSTSVRPIDYFESAIPSGWILDGGKHKVLGVFNWNTNAALKVDWPFAYAGLDATKKYVGFDFWRKEFIPPFSGAVRLDVPPDDCRIIALAEVGEDETVVSTSLHVAAPIYGTRGDVVLTIAGEPLEVRTYSTSAGFRKVVIPAGAGGWRNLRRAGEIHRN